MVRLIFRAGLVLLVALGFAVPAQAQRKLPYWASIAAGEARMRTGPGREFPASWLYQRVDLPVRVIAVYNNWRKIEDPEGVRGWMQANLLRETRTALIIGEVRALRDKPEPSAQIIWRAEPGVIGRISDCLRGWCKFDVRGRMGFVEASSLWGVDAAEQRR